MTKTTVFHKQSKTLQDALYQTGAQVWYETLISDFLMLPIFWISRLSFDSLLEKIKALTQSALPTSPFTLSLPTVYDSLHLSTSLINSPPLSISWTD